MSEEKKKYKSLLSVPVKVEMSEVKHSSQHVITVDELTIQIEEAKKGTARVDSKYVNYEEKGHVFEYELNYPQFLEDITYIIKEGKKRRSSLDRYQNSHQMIIQ